MSASPRLAGLGIAALLALLAPIPYGATGPLPRGLIALLVACGLLAVRSSIVPAPPARFAWLALAALAVPLAQLVPLPPAALERLSPREAQEARASLALAGEPAGLAEAEGRMLAAAGVPRPPSGWRPVSADPDGTIEAAGRLAMALGAFLLALLSASEPRERRWLLGAVTLSAFLQASYGLAETLSGHEHVLFRAKEHYADIPSGTFICPNHFAALLSLGLFLLAGLAIAPAEKREGDPARSVARALLAATAGAVMLVALLWSSSRGALAAAAAAALGLGAFLALRGRDRLAAAGLGTAAAFALLAGAIWMRPPTPLAEDVANLSLSGRSEIWRTSILLARDHPWVGSGLGTYGAVHPLYRPPGAAARVLHAHSDYLEWWAETGLPGLAVLALALAALGSGALRLLRRRRAGPLSAAGLFGLSALALHEAADFSLQLPGVAVPAAIAAGALLAPLRWGPLPGRPLARAHAHRAAVVALALLAGLLGLHALTARRPVTGGDTLGVRLASTAEGMRRAARSRIAMLAARAREEGRPVDPHDLGPPLALLRRAALRAPLRGEIRISTWFANRLLAAALPEPERPPGLAALGRYYLERAEQLAPHDRRQLALLIRCWLAAGAPAEARRVARRLLALEPSRAEEVYAALGDEAGSLGELMEATPNSADAAVALARFLLRGRRDPAGAQIVLERAVERHPEAPRPRLLLAAVLLQRDRPEEALATLDAGPVASGVERRHQLALRARLLIELRRLEALPPLLEELTALGSDPREVALLRARAELAAGARERALARLAALREGGLVGLPERERLEILLLYGRELARGGAFARALPVFREAAAIDPDQPEVRRFFERLEQAAGPASAGRLVR